MSKGRGGSDWIWAPLTHLLRVYRSERGTYPRVEGGSSL